mmetsp:Transcript_27587/g.38905  ORF Transcript_27587/g.38905 Transcript_27587/m.38905 type:complete len:236 (+) Transcript_27587:59-766(+)
MSKQRFLKNIILVIALLIFAFSIIAIPVEWYIYKYTIQSGNISTETTIKEYYDQVKVESKTTGGSSQHTTTSTHSYDDTDQNDLKSLYEGMVTLTVLVIIAEFIVVVCMLINTLGRCCPTKIKMGLKFGKKIFKKLTVVASIIVFLVLFIAVIVFAVQHPKALTSDNYLGSCEDALVDNGYDEFCKDFTGDGFGPGAGWYLILVSLIFSLPQLVLVWTYACSCGCIKRGGYTSVR